MRLLSSLGGRLGKIADSLRRSDDLSSEILMVRALAVDLIELEGDHLLEDTGARSLRNLLALLQRLEKLMRTNQRIRELHAASPAERTRLMGTVRRVVLNYLPPAERPAFEQGVRTRLGLATVQALPRVLRVAATEDEETAPRPAPLSATAFLGERAAAIAADLDTDETLIEEVHLARTLVAGYLERHRDDLLTDEGVPASRGDPGRAPRLDVLLDLLARLERLADAERAIRSSQEAIVEEILVWAGVVLSEALRYVARTDLAAFRKDVRQELGLDLGPLTTMVEVHEDHGIWMDGTAQGLLTVAQGEANATED